MPKSVNSKYSKKDFEKDLKELENLIKENHKGGKKSKKNQKGGAGEMMGDTFGDHMKDNFGDHMKDNFGEPMGEKFGEPMMGGKKSKKHQSAGKKSKKHQSAGKKEYTGSYRHFRVIKLNGKEVKFGNVSIKETQTPLNAARKLLLSVAKHQNLTKSKKLGLKAVYLIQETTRGSAHKIFGPYQGKYVKYTAEEAKTAMTADGKVKFTMKPVVKLVKEKNSAQKGGSKL
jgi:hypothetical protein